ncbi:MAG: hypothetical protein II136_02590 [Prevotella sp.]|nr:hypothetical protein [Prevotella sp.]
MLLCVGLLSASAQERLHDHSPCARGSLSVASRVYVRVSGGMGDSE